MKYKTLKTFVRLETCVGACRVARECFWYSRGIGCFLFASTLLSSLTFTAHFYTMPWSPQERARAVELFLQKGSPGAALRALRREWGPRAAPGREALRRWVRQFREEGSVQGDQHRRRPLHAAPADLAKLRRAICRNPRLSVRRLSTKIGLPRSTIHRLLRRQLRLFPYKLQLR